MFGKALPVLALLTAPSLQAQVCSSHSPASVPTVVELYTSEGCDSCPPADRWLSGLKSSRPDVVAAAFHVDYWDRLGWKDRFASPAFTARQQQGLAHSGARFAFTPQIIVNGRDWRGSSVPPASTTPAVVALKLQRAAADQVKVELQPRAGAPARVQLWWAQLEDGHRTEVRAGENRGATLGHDAVVRDYASLAPGGAEQQLLLKLKPTGEDGRPRRLLVVAVDPATGRVLQAGELGC
jgi:hypothetical protein